MIYATKGVATIPLKNLKIIGDKFIYDKFNSELIIFDNVRYIDKDNKIIIESQKMVYSELTNSVFSQSKTFLEFENKYDIRSSDILFDRNLNIISSKKVTEIDDKNNNKFLFNEGLIFNTFNEIIKSYELFKKNKWI